MAKRSLRRSHVIAPFGVGAIWNVGKESFVGMDTTQWGNPDTKLNLERLERAMTTRLGYPIKHFLAPPAKRSFGGGARLPYYRFPAWMFCKNCHAMTEVRPRDEQPDEPPRCAKSKCVRRPVLVPMRFVMVCGDGHLADVPWPRWLHTGKTCASHDLEFRTDKSKGLGLESLIVSCRGCKAAKSVKDLFRMQNYGPSKQGRILCYQQQPWQRPDAPDCNQSPVVVQRGAGDVYFAVTASAIDIPPDSDYVEFNEPKQKVINHTYFPTIRSVQDSPIKDSLIKNVAEELGITSAQVRKIVETEVAQVTGKTPPNLITGGDLLADEYLAFLSERVDQDPRDRFVTTPSTLRPIVPDPLANAVADHFDRAVIANRLRVVRAFAGFERYTREKLVPPDLGAKLDWLPGMETYGEGIFLTLDEDRVEAWERNPHVEERINIIARRHSSLGAMARNVPLPSARFVLLHTLAHLLIRQFAFDAGYNSASLAERIYARSGKDEAMAGLLVYTADGDSEGTLGGLARIGTPLLVARAVLGALQRAQWCSSDPICSESGGQGSRGMNRAACHACALLAETSCDHMNTALDRVLLVGNGECPGYFEQALRAAENEVVPL